MKHFIFILFLFFTGYRASAQVIEGQSEPEVFTFVEQAPEFPGGDDALIKYISDNTVYPDAERLKNIEGRTLLRFVVMEDGHVDKIEVLHSAGNSALDNEAVRVVKSIPNFKPGMQQGKKVRVYFNIPVTFRLLSKAEQKQHDRDKKKKQKQQD